MVGRVGHASSGGRAAVAAATLRKLTAGMGVMRRRLGESLSDVTPPSESPTSSTGALQHAGGRQDNGGGAGRQAAAGGAHLALKQTCVHLAFLTIFCSHSCSCLLACRSYTSTCSARGRGSDRCPRCPSPCSAAPPPETLTAPPSPPHLALVCNGRKDGRRVGRPADVADRRAQVERHDGRRGEGVVPELHRPV